MDKVCRQIPRKFLVETSREAHLLQALIRTKMPATQSALRRIAEQKITIACAGVLGSSDLSNTQYLGDLSPDPPVSAEVLLRTLASALQAWRSHLPAQVQPGLLALVRGDVAVDVQSITFCPPDLIRLLGFHQGQTYRLITPVSGLRFVCIPKTQRAEKAFAGVLFDLQGDVFLA
jgi:hypothetical protein